MFIVEVAEFWPGFCIGCANGIFQGNVSHTLFPSCTMTAGGSEPRSCSLVVIHAILAAVY